MILIVPLCLCPHPAVNRGPGQPHGDDLQLQERHLGVQRDCGQDAAGREFHGKGSFSTLEAAIAGRLLTVWFLLRPPCRCTAAA